MLFLTSSFLLYGQISCGNAPNGIVYYSNPGTLCQSDVSAPEVDFGNEFYRVNNSSTYLEINVNVHVMQFSASNPQNFIDNLDNRNKIKNIVENNGQVYANSGLAEICINPDPSIVSQATNDSRIKLKLNQIYFHVDQTGFYANSWYYNHNTYVNGTSLDNQLNVFICPGFSTYSGVGLGLLGEAGNSVILKPTYTQPTWEATRLLVHEVNHCLGLYNTINSDRSYQLFLNDYKCNGCTGAYGSFSNNHNMMYGGAMDYLSRLQVGHMRRNLLTTWRKKLLVNQSLTNGTHVLEKNHTVNTGQLIVLTDDLLIKTGFTLTVNGMIRMTANRRIVVERGAKLIVNNGGKISSCSGTWQAIYVEGSPNGQNTHVSSLVANKSGVLVLNQGSTIENAQNAVSMSAFHIPWPNTSYYGGYVYANGTIITNCGKAFEFMSYARNGAKDQSKIMNSTINNCVNGITIWADDGITVDNTVFNVSNNGIYALDAEVLVNNGCTFNYCAIGVFLNNTINYAYGSQIGSLGGNQFNYCGTGVKATAQNTSGLCRIENNTFYGNSGIHIDGVSRYRVGNNNLNNCSYGLQLQSSGSGMNNSVIDNKFQSNSFGIYYLNNNSTSKIQSNCFNNTVGTSIYGASGSLLLSPQGNATTAASNCFDNNSSSFLNYGNFINYYRDPSVGCTYINNSTGIGYYNSLAADIPCNASGFRQSPSNASFNESNWSKAYSEVTASLNDKSISSSEIKEFKLQKYNLLLDWVGFKLQENKSKMSEIIGFIGDSEDFYDKSVLFSLYTSNNDVVNAAKILSSIKDRDELSNDFVFAQNLMLNYLNNPTLYKISNRDKTALYNIGLKTEPFYGYARGIYYVLCGEHIISKLNEGELSARSKSTPKEITLVPNPFQNTIQLSELPEEASIKVYNIHGQSVMQLDTKNNLEVIDLSHINTGIYFVHINSKKHTSTKIFRISKI